MYYNELDYNELTPIQIKTINRFHDVIHSYYVKGHSSYTTLMGDTLNLQDVLRFLSDIVCVGYYSDKEKDYLNSIRSMYISLTHNVS